MDNQNFWAVGTSLPGGAWMLEGLFTTEDKAIANCGKDMFIAYPVPVDKLTARNVEDAEVIYWPHLQTKEEGLIALSNYRVSLLQN